MPRNKHKAIDLFCGAGGSSYGTMQAGVNVVAGFDMWKLAGEVYKDNFPKATFFEGKLQNVRIKTISRKLGKIDLIIASPECTSHSVARGKRKQNEESLRLAYQVLRFAKEFNPRWLIIENVVSMREWADYPKFLRKLGKSYKYVEQVLLASDFGVPQSRRRLFIICDRDQEPPAIGTPKKIRRKPASAVINKSAKYELSKLKKKGRAKSTLERANRAFSAIGKTTPFLIVYYGSDAAGGWQQLSVPLRTITTLDRFALVTPSRDGKGHSMRMLQPCELQAAMGFPHSFKLNRGTRREKIHLLGNAVCPPVMQAIVETLIKQG